MRKTWKVGKRDYGISKVWVSHSSYFWSVLQKRIILSLWSCLSLNHFCSQGTPGGYEELGNVLMAVMEHPDCLTSYAFSKYYCSLLELPTFLRSVKIFSLHLLPIAWMSLTYRILSPLFFFGNGSKIRKYLNK